MLKVGVSRDGLCGGCGGGCKLLTSEWGGVTFGPVGLGTGVTPPPI